MRFSASSGRSNSTSSSRVVMTVWSRRAPMFSMRSFALAAMRAISLMPSWVNSSVAPSAAHRAAYCLVRAFSGSVMMRTKSASVSGCSSTRIGKRPWSSGIRSEGLVAWNAPAAMNRMWSVRTKPYRVCTVEPSTMGSRSRCTRSEEHTSELQSQSNLVCRLLLEKKKTDLYSDHNYSLAAQPRGYHDRDDASTLATSHNIPNAARPVESHHYTRTRTKYGLHDASY